MPAGPVQAAFNFPTGFLWGTATASHQVEGNNTNNSWWAWEQEPGHIIQGQKSGLACDWWGGRWKEDFDRAAETGQNAHRLSIEWSRVQPAPDRWDENAIDYYRQMMRGLIERKMTPLVTLHHFSDPIWLMEMGGWENEAVVEKFTAYARKVVDALKEYVNLWVTINEPNVYAYSGYVAGAFPPGKKDLGAAFGLMVNQVRAHAAAYRAIHEIQPTARVGIATNYVSMQPARSWLPFDRLITRIQSQLYNHLHADALRSGVVNFLYKKIRVPEVANTQDFIGINYYTRNLVAFNLTATEDAFGKRFFPEGADISPTGFIANIPEGFFEALRFANSFHLPIMVTENGVEDDSDHLRPRYTAQHIHQVWRAVNFSWPIKGYFHWTLVDNFEWERGWTQRFGLWELDVDSQARRRRSSVDLYEAICRENRLSSEMVARYCPEVQKVLFPAE